MPISSAASGTQTATVGTEHTLATLTVVGTYVLNVDTTNLVAGEAVTLRIKTKTLSAGASGLAFDATYKHGQGKPQKYSIPVPVLVEGVFTLQQTGGTGRAFPWNIAKLDG